MATTDNTGFDWSGLADVLGNASKGGLDAQQKNDALKLALANAQTARQKSVATLPSARLGASAQASLAAHATPSQVQWDGPGSGLKGKLPQFTGGINDAVANLDPKTRALAQQAMQDELVQQMQGGASGGNQDASMPQVGQSSTADKLLGSGALASSLLGALGKGASGSTGSFTSDGLKGLLNKILHPGGVDNTIMGNGIQPDDPTNLGALDPNQLGPAQGIEPPPNIGPNGTSTNYPVPGEPDYPGLGQDGYPSGDDSLYGAGY